ncbi:MAG: alkaline phosphatase family protein [Gemmatimonadetes bacterium]|nr:alkaline phosphatase family protein [Gemmatimonadota bacterium]
MRIAFAIPAALLALALAGCEEPAPPAPPRSMILGLDGCDWRNALPLVRQGKLPTVEALWRAGARGTMLTNPDYRWSPVLWTSIATGKLPQEHGVTSFMAQVEGMDRWIPTPSTERKVRALWNMFTEKDRSVGFVGWWVTWPAEPVKGFMVTDHFSVSRFDLGNDYERERESVFSEQETWPPELGQQIAALKVPRQRIGREDYARFVNLPADWQWPEHFRKFDKASEFAIAHSVDRTHSGAGQRLLRDVEPDLFGVFLQGIDIMQHYYWEYLDPSQAFWSPSDAEVREYGEAIERYYGWIDGVVADLVEAGGDRAVLIVSDHGFRPADDRYEDKHISGEHRRQAVWLFAGPGARRDVIVPETDAVDVTPTILAYHGLPVAHDFDGDPVLDVMTPEWQAAHPVEWIATWETSPLARRELPGSSNARDLEERIRALGYIE